MIFEFLKKQKKFSEKLRLTKIMIMNLQVSEEQKALYIRALEILDEIGIDKIYNTLSNFVENIEIKKLEDIQKNHFSVITGMKRQEAEEKKQEINTFSFLLNNM
ncbi:MAG: hypothetical protein LBU14_05335 [Candidatus Peribacteria bacterium]|jgi:ribosomal protein L19|nr:hypothetical protein [Candidatus Peribacteria bacterium]